ncbi:uncharacterized protein [Diadema setosum]|uniref:uncharacterized protein n=1 Tax=Diadema setosum TaxID=31175 RepID=UPI003B3A1C91
MKSWRRSEEESGGSTPGTGSRWKKVSSWQLLDLRHLVSGTKYSDMQYGWRVPENALSVVAREACQAICDEYADEVMTAPSTPDGWKQLAGGGFYKRWNFPHCVAAIDGKHVTIRKPPLSGSLCCNYKGFLV